MQKRGAEDFKDGEAHECPTIGDTQSAVAAAALSPVSPRNWAHIE